MTIDYFLEHYEIMNEHEYEYKKNISNRSTLDLIVLYNWNDAHWLNQSYNIYFFNKNNYILPFEVKEKYTSCSYIVDLQVINQQQFITYYYYNKFYCFLSEKGTNNILLMNENSQQFSFYHLLPDINNMKIFHDLENEINARAFLQQLR